MKVRLWCEQSHCCQLRSGRVTHQIHATVQFRNAKNIEINARYKPKEEVLPIVDEVIRTFNFTETVYVTRRFFL